MSRIHDWELEYPFKDLMEILGRNGQIRDRDDVNLALRTLVDCIKDVDIQIGAAIQRQEIVDAERRRDRAQEKLTEILGDQVPF